MNKQFENFLNSELEKIYHWLIVNKLSLNVGKTKFMLFHTVNTHLSYIPTLVINDIIIERVKNFNFLGLTINENLSWKPHVDKISNKISKYSGVISRLKHYLPLNILRIIYCSTIQTNITYSLLGWGYDCSRLVKTQKKIIRNICCRKYNAHTEPLFKELRLLKLEDLLKLNILKFFYRLKHGNLPEYFKSYQTPEEIHVRETRYNSYVMIPENDTRLRSSQKCLRNNLHVVLNDTPQIVLSKVNSHSFQGFSNYAKQNIINNYAAYCSIIDCYVCEHEFD